MSTILTNEPGMTHETDRRELPAFLVKAYEISAAQPLPKAVQDDMDQFVARETARAMEARPRSDGGENPHQREAYKALRNAAINHAANWTNVRDQLGMNHQEGFTPTYTADKGLLLVARNPDTEQIVGFSSALLSQDDEGKSSVGDTYVGSSASEGRGIGGALVLLRNRLLAQNGITSYITWVWSGSERMYQRIGASFTELPNETEEASSTRKSLLITLDSERLEHQCAEQLHMDPDANMLETSVEVSADLRSLGHSALMASGLPARA